MLEVFDIVVLHHMGDASVELSIAGYQTGQVDGLGCIASHFAAGFAKGFFVLLGGSHFLFIEVDVMQVFGSLDDPVDGVVEFFRHGRLVPGQ
ncbi:hypothetical protein D3C76_1539390 [compost metagenome]